MLAPNYIQHNSQIADGVSGLTAALEAMGKQGITMQSLLGEVRRLIPKPLW
ncbi:hypothetical protein GHI33_04195 [Glaesserella parasuis]|nr:hypothetical protein [Glaesserella parasuis]MWQ06108.1 hypothetical protein [Glaesserella parasuis]